MKREILHTRQIKIEAYDVGGDRMLIVGRLDDTRPNDFHTLHGQIFPAGIIHDMSLELDVSMPDLTIADARVHMPQVPRDGCREVIPGLAALVGLKVAGGFTHEVRRLLGGPRNCAHLVSLILAMAPVIVQAASAYLQQQPITERTAMVGSHLVNSCYMWREDGPNVRDMRAQLGQQPEGASSR